MNSKLKIFQYWFPKNSSCPIQKCISYVTPWSMNIETSGNVLNLILIPTRLINKFSQHPLSPKQLLDCTAHTQQLLPQLKCEPKFINWAYILKTGLAGWKNPQKIHIFHRKIVSERKNYQFCNMQFGDQEASGGRAIAAFLRHTQPLF